MDCNVVKDLIPLYIDDCCSEESKKIVEEHIGTCSHCNEILEEMKKPEQVVSVSQVPAKFNKLNDWKASLLQSVLLFISFALITVGVALESKTPLGLMNGFWAFNLVIPATAFLLSLTNWYFVNHFKSRRIFSNASCVATIFFALCCYKWGVLHYYHGTIFDFDFLTMSEIGILATVILCALSKILSNQYAKMLGKE